MGEDADARPTEHEQQDLHVVRVGREAVGGELLDDRRTVEVLEREGHHAGEEHARLEAVGAAHREDLVREGDDQPEVAAAAAERPEELGLALGAGGHQRAVRQHDLRRDQVVDGQPRRLQPIREVNQEVSVMLHDDACYPRNQRNNGRDHSVLRLQLDA